MGWALCGLLLSASGAHAQEDFELPEGDASQADTEPGEPVTAPTPPTVPSLSPESAPKAPHGPPSVLVIVRTDVPALAGWARDLGEKATQKLARQQSAQAADLQDVLDPQAAGRREQRKSEAQAEVQEGLLAFEGFEVDRAKVILQDAVEGLLADLPTLGSAQRRALAQGLFGLAASALFDGQEARADALLINLAALEPGFEPEAGRYPSNLSQRFERLRSRRETAPVGRITIETEPVGTQVFLDGGFRGYTPLELTEVAVGSHALSLSHPAYAPEGRLVSIKPAQITRFEAQLVDGPGAGLWRSLGAAFTGDSAAQRALAVRLPVARVALIQLQGSALAPRAQGVWLHDKGEPLAQVQPRDLSPDLNTAAAQLVVGIVGAEALPGPLAEVSAESGGQGTLTDQWWFWVAVGSVAAAAAATTTWVATRGGDAGPPRNTAIFRF